ncbi:MAG: redoxin domain-containing protein [Oceanihabitans sp.]
MQRIIYLLCALFFVIACKNETTNGYSIEGKIDKAPDNALVKLVRTENNKVIQLDTTRVQNNSFEFSGDIANAADMYYLQIEGIQGSMPIIIANEKIKMNLFADSIYASTFTGGKQSNYFSDYQLFIKELRIKGNAINAKAQIANKNNDTMQLNLMRKEYALLNEQNKANDIDFVTKNTDAILSALILERSFTTKRINIQQTKDLFSKLNPEVQNTRAGKNIQQLLSKNLKTAIGSKISNFSGPSPEGKTIAFNDVKGKITIIDFWAAWCGPCRKENPNVVKIYNKYHDKGLEIIGISLDGTPRQKNAKKAWTDAIEKDALNWHHISNLQYFNDPIAKEFNINSIPATYIIDANGVILAKNLRGKALENKIAELLD